MDLCRTFIAAPVLATTLLIVNAAVALERVAVPATQAHRDGWDAANNCTVTYSNTCTGWTWVWSGWEPGDRFGVDYWPCEPDGGGTLIATKVRFYTGAPSGYGYTGTLEVSPVDVDGCVGTPFAVIPLLPATDVDQIQDGWNYPATRTALVFTNGDAEGSPVALSTDHPAAGPTGPPACGACYPSTRTTHTFCYGTESEPLCPGEPMSDGTCNVEIDGWAAVFDIPVHAVGETSWASIKGMYR